VGDGDRCVGPEGLGQAGEAHVLGAGVATSVQTTIVTGRLDVVPWMIRYCLDNKVRRVSFLPFIPRGSGFARQTDYQLTRAERLDHAPESTVQS